MSCTVGVMAGAERRWWLGWVGIDPPWSEERRARLEIIKLGLRASPAAAGLLAILVVLEVSLAVGMMLANGHLIGSVVSAVAGGATPETRSQLDQALILIGGLYLANAVVPAIATDVAIWVGQRADHVLRLRLADNMTDPVGIAHLEDAAIKDEVARAGALGLFTPGAAIHGMTDVLVSRLSSLGAFVLVAQFRWWLGAGLLLVYQAIEVQARRRYMEVARVVYAQTQDFRRSEYIRSVALGGSPKETRIFGMKEWVVERYRSSWLGAMADVWRDRRRASFKQAWTTPVQVAVSLLAYVVVARSVLDGEIGVGRATVVVSAIGGVGGFISFGLHRTRTEYGVTAFRPVLTLADKIGRLSPLSRAAGGTAIAALPERSIRFESVGFRYPGRETDVYDGLDLEIPAGRSLAIVGVNGAGKTTLCKLVARCYEPTAGRITVDGIDVADLDPSAWQRTVAAVFQDFVGFPLSVSDNVGFGAVDRLGDREGLVDAARQAGILDHIDSLEYGWDSILNRTFDKGAELSGGQWQRVALARALFAVRSGARVLILDEPTASLDVRGEAELFDRYLELTRGVTSILVSHRFSTVRKADRICVLDAGRVSESGTHEELLAMGGTYAEMFNLQASRFTTTGSADA